MIDRGQDGKTSRWMGLPLLSILLIALAFTLAYHLLARSVAPGILLSLDDGYIHASIARTFATTGHFAIQPSAESGGSSSLLWTLLISLLALVRVPADVATLLLGFVAFPFLLLTVYRFALEVVSPRLALLATLLLGLSGMQAAMALTGMESQLAVAFLFGGFGALFRGQKRFATVCFSLAVLTRPEMLLAPFALLIVQFLPGTDEENSSSSLTWSQLGIITGTALLGVALLSLLSGGLPSTFAARRWLYGLGEGLFATQGPALPIYIRFITDMAHRFAGMIGPGGLIGWFWALVVLELVITGVVVLWTRGKIARAFLLFLLLHLLFVMFGLGSSGHLGRYLEPLWVAIPLLALVGWGKAFGWLHGRLQRGIAVALALLLIAGLIPQIPRWSHWHSSSALHLFRLHHEMAILLRDKVPEGETIAAFDIGLMSWESHHPILDLGGLNSREMVSRMYAGTVPQLLSDHHIRLVVLPAPRNPRLAGIMAQRLGFRPGTLKVLDALQAASSMDVLNATRVAMPALHLLEFLTGGR